MNRNSHSYQKMLCCAAAAISLSCTAQAQDGASVVVEDSRAGQIVKAEQEKAKSLTPVRTPRGELKFDEIQRRFLDPLTTPNGFSVMVGGLPTGGGFSLGPRYTRRDLWNERLISDTSVVGSTKRWWRGQSSLSLPYLFNGHLELKADGAYENAASVPFFGEAQQSGKSTETDFRREFTTAHMTALSHLLRQKLTLGYSVGGLLTNIGPGNRDDEPATDALFSNNAVPGLLRQSNFVLGTAITELNLTKPGFSNPAGLSLEAADTQFWDQSGNNASFHLLQTQATYYLPFLNGMRALVFRIKNESTFHGQNQVVPFYLQPTLGGPDNLRGYQRYRYYGNDTSLVSAEYRWSVSGMLEMAVFGDAGNVYDRPGLIGFRHVRADGGVGFRFKEKELSAMRIDIGVSPEGVNVWFVFNDAFGKLRRYF
jgi:hypothetical protein